ncbi:CNH domain-containing protein [Dimargaris cristalligena]|uniref:CNH domain-containing protein n=1 Tax=Dimargaris cristalligena TaxID=215637 RepID=A0A4P9ZK77_9FUNG|nr:CNH domain-containing protein [Dimargaris cristalligena]|eukprot:RKP33637.1 CNH domain-containing protein [Dimargaris cristalligena]
MNLSNFAAFQAAVQEAEAVGDGHSIWSTTDSDHSPSHRGSSLYSSMSDRTEAEAFWDANQAPAMPYSLSVGSESSLSLSRSPTLWSQTASTALLESLPPEIIHWQETMFEAICREQEYLTDLRLIHTIFIKPLRASWPRIVSFYATPDVLAAAYGGSPVTFLRPELDTLIDHLFHNYTELIRLSEQLLGALLERQANQPIMSGVGDLFLSWAQHIVPIETYAANLPLASYILEVETGRNPQFAAFIKECEDNPLARKLGIRHFIGRATSRFPRYPLHFQEMVKRAPASSPDRTLLPQVTQLVKGCLDRVNLQMGQASERLLITKLRNQLQLAESDRMYLGITSKRRQVLKVGTLRKKSGSPITLFLLDHMLLVCKHTKRGRSQTQIYYQLYRPPIPLPLLSVQRGEDSTRASADPAGHGATAYPSPPLGGRSHRASVLFSRRPAKSTDCSRPIRPMSFMPGTVTPQSDSGVTDSFDFSEAAAPLTPLVGRAYPLQFQRLGRCGGFFTLYAASAPEQAAWIESIGRQQQLTLSSLAQQVSIQHICDHTFRATSVVHCATDFTASTGQRYILVGCDDGLFVGSDRSRGGYLKITKLKNVTQMHVFAEFNQLLVLSDRYVHVFQLHELEQPQLWDRLKGRKLSIKAAHFSVGRYATSRPVVAFGQPKSKQTTFILARPLFLSDYNKRTDDKLLWSTKEKGRPEVGLVRLLEFFVPSDAPGLAVFRQHLSVPCQETFEIIDVNDLRRHDSLPHPGDPSFADLPPPAELGRPLLMSKLATGEFLLCYQSLAFFVDKAQSRSRSNVVIQWEGRPQHIQVFYPYIYAFDSDFIEIRHVDTGALEHIIPAIGVKSLTLPDSDVSNARKATYLLGAMQSRIPGYQRIFQLPLAVQPSDTPGLNGH